MRSNVMKIYINNIQRNRELRRRRRRGGGEVVRKGSDG
jgi:hypothetical protein